MIPITGFILVWTDQFCHYDNSASANIVCFIFQIRIDADVTVQVKFRQFENSEGRDEAGSLCESVSRTCETYFILCVRLSGLIPTSFSGCDYKSSNKKPIASNLINFQTQATNIAKNIVFRRTHWNGVRCLIVSLNVTIPYIFIRK